MPLKIEESRKIGFSTSIQKARREGKIERKFLISKANTHIQPTVGEVAKVFLGKVKLGILLG